MVLGWGGVVAWLLLTARSDLVDAQGELRRIRDDAGPSELLEPGTDEELRVVAGRLRRAHDKLTSPVVAPVRILPVLGRQLRSASAITEGAARATALSADALATVSSTLEDARAPDTDRVAVLRRLAGVADETHDGLAAIELGPEEALIGPLQEARLEFRAELDELLELLETVEVASSGVASVIEGPACHLLLAANNAEMRAGSGMFLQAGELCFAGGELELGDLTEASALQLPPTAVEIADDDLRDRWGFLLPNAEWRNLALSPRFPANAALAADMWRAATGRDVAGVIAVDPVALEALLHATGPIEVAGRTYRPDDVVDQLLIEQYEGFLDEDYDADARQDLLGEVAGEAVAAFDSGGWDLETLVEHLPDASAGRHIIAWARDPEAQRAWEAMGVAGTLGPDSLLLSVLNRGGGRGGGKLDPFLDVEADLQLFRDRTGGTGVTIDVTLENTLRPGTPTYTEDPDDDDVRFGVYEGIVSVNVPGAAQALRIEPGELLARGDDGPTKVVATRIELAAGERTTVRVRFRLPSEHGSLRIEPSARIPATEWRTPGDRTQFDVLTIPVRW